MENQDTSSVPYVGQDAEDVKERIETQQEMADAITK